MRVLHQRLLRGASQYCARPCVLALLEAAPSTIDAGPQVAYTARFLQQACGEAVEFMHAEAVAGTPGQWQVVVEYALEHVGQAALAAAVRLVNATENGQALDVAAAVAALRELASALRRPAAPPAPARIPVVVVAGSNGKTTTTLMIAHAAQLAGLRTGCASSVGMTLGGVRHAEGDATSYWSQRNVLASPLTEFAVLETARAELLRHGMPCERCSVGVMLNVSDDLADPDSARDLTQWSRARTLAVAAADVAVLNADDAHCVAARARLAAHARAMYFSMQADHPVLLNHLAQGGDAVWLEHDTVVLSQRQVRQRLLNVSHMPATCGGLARHHIANGMAAAAALAASGFSAAQICAALSSFEPVCTQVYALGSMQIVLDRARDPAACMALATLARGLAQGQPPAPGRVLALVTAPARHDAGDAGLARLGAACAAHFDQLYVYGAPAIADGALAAGGAQVHREAAAEAMQAAYRACQPGDVLVCTDGTAVTALVEAIRAIDAPAAERLVQLAAPAL